MVSTLEFGTEQNPLQSHVVDQCIGTVFKFASKFKKQEEGVMVDNITMDVLQPTDAVAVRGSDRGPSTNLSCISWFRYECFAPESLLQYCTT